VIIVTTPPHSTAVMERASPPHSAPDRCWNRHQHRRIERGPAVLITTSDHNTDRRWCLGHFCRMVCRTDVVIPVITAGSSVTPAVLRYQVLPDHDLTRRWSNRQHRRVVRWSCGDDPYLRRCATGGDQWVCIWQRVVREQGALLSRSTCVFSSILVVHSR
jgi:hypothetical protein